MRKTGSLNGWSFLTSSFFSLKGAKMGPKKEKHITNEELAMHCSKLLPLVEKIVLNSGFRLLKLAFISESGRYCLRLTITHYDRSISLTDCELVTKKVEKELDLKDPIPFSYILEVESPGIDIESKKKVEHQFVLEPLGLTVKS